MSSVTSRIGEIKQPRGGYIKPSEFKAVHLDDGITLHEKENLHSSVIGLSVDYLSRFLISGNAEDAFKISLKGADIAEKDGIRHARNIANQLLDGIKGCDDASVINTCKLVTFDVWYRKPSVASLARDCHATYPDKETIENIQTLVKRSCLFFEKYGPITKDGFSFEPATPSSALYAEMLLLGKGTYGGYTPTVQSGDGDFLTSDTLWDFKVSKSKPKSRDTLQLLMYWVMGQHSQQDIYKNITKLGIFNPRLNTVFLFDMKNLSDEVIQIIENEVICYEPLDCI